VSCGAGGGDAETGRGTLRCWTTGPSADGRLDIYLADQLGLSRSRAASLLAEDCVRVDGRVPKKSTLVAVGQRIEARLPPPAPVRAQPQNIPLEIVYQDSDVVVVDKQPGLVVHPGPGHWDDTLVNALLHHVGDLSGIGGKLRPGIVHRLDQDTSGLIVAAKTDRAHQSLSEALKRREVTRVYLTALWGGAGASPWVVDRPIGRHPSQRTRMAVVADGRPARTTFASKERWLAATLCEARLTTGRTHQIRVHAAAAGHPVVGDALYGAGREKGFSGRAARWAAELARRTPRQFLHATRLAFRHPATDKRMAFETPLPPDLARVREWARDTRGHG